MATSILWHDSRSGGAEVCILTSTEETNILRGTIVRPFDGEPAIVRYLVEADPTWRTMHVWTELVMAETTRALELSADGEGHWSSADADLSDLDGCIDIDLGASPSTNTLPIRRLNLEQGQTRDVRAAWVRYPELTVEVLEQSYERLAADRYRYRSATFSAELTVEGNGLVVDYEGVWRAEARSTSA
jgi:hypothetical protein